MTVMGNVYSEEGGKGLNYEGKGLNVESNGQISLNGRESHGSGMIRVYYTKRLKEKYWQKP